MTMNRRPYLLAPGEQLLLSSDPFVTAQRFMDFVAQTHLDPDDVVVTPLVTTPLPLYRAGEKFTGVAPELMWLPLFWLPENIGLRYQLDEGDGEPRVETDVEWAVRVALELQAAGLYDADAGWTDVLALNGLDVQNPVDLARVEAWQNGVPDPDLDSIDLSPMFAEGEDAWAVAEAADVLAVAEPAQWAMSAASLLNTLDEDANLLEPVAALGFEMLVDEPSDAADKLSAAAEALAEGAAAATWEPSVRTALETVIDAHSAALQALGGEEQA